MEIRNKKPRNKELESERTPSGMFPNETYKTVPAIGPPFLISNFLFLISYSFSAN